MLKFMNLFFVFEGNIYFFFNRIFFVIWDWKYYKKIVVFIGLK